MLVAGGNSGLMSGADKKKLDDATATDIASTLVMRDTNKRAKFATLQKIKTLLLRNM